MIFRSHKRILIFVLLALLTACTHAADVLEQVKSMHAASLLALDEKGDAMVSFRADIPRIPASTLKILTAWLAIDYWGLDHRFETDFFLDADDILWIKGFGDPMLVSEEIQTMAARLKSRGLTKVNGIRLDSSYFGDGLVIDGRSYSNNPYDAPVAALAANFNTVNVVKTGQDLRSAEPQTPLTDVARGVARHLKNGRQRVNIQDSHLSARYFGEILRAKLQQQGVQVSGSIKNQRLPANLPRYYQHLSSQTLEQTLRAMLRYSTNFIANQLFLMLGAEAVGAPASFEKSRHYARQRITSRFHWKIFNMVEGAGLSRQNRISSAQMIMLLEAFEPYRDLLPSPEQGIRAKTGTLKGVSCYAGYVADRPFALFINQPVSYGLRLQVARALLQRSERPSAPVR